VMTKDTFLLYMPVTLCKVVLSENYPSTKIPHKNLRFQRYLHFPIFFYFQMEH
jgi:hypothetical protein